jgi:hypothetical protein
MKRKPARDEPVDGMDVFGADGVKVGTIVALSATCLVVEKGFFFPGALDNPLARTLIGGIAAYGANQIAD